MVGRGVISSKKQVLLKVYGLFHLDGIIYYQIPSIVVYYQDMYNKDILIHEVSKMEDTNKYDSSLYSKTS